MPRTKGAIGKPRRFSAASLREPLKRMQAKLKAAGVPKDALPTNDYLLGLIPMMINWNAVDTWAERFARRVMK
jgi:hypothetical protein